MPAKKGGKKHKRFKKGNNLNEKRELIYKQDGQDYAQVTKLLGNRNLIVYCFEDEKERIAHIPGKMRKRNWVNMHDIVLINIREYQDEKCDVSFIYNLEEVFCLKAYNELPDNVQTNQNINNSDDELEIEFEY